jgi:hypothetical protein
MDNKDDVFLDNEEAHPLTLPANTKKKATSSFTDRTNKLLHYLVGITICGALFAFFPSWMVILHGSSSWMSGTSRIKQPKLRSSSAATQDNNKSRINGGENNDYDYLKIAGSIPSCAEHTFLTLYEKPSQLPHLSETTTEESNSNNKDKACKGMLLRDDIVLTTHECSQSPSLFFPSPSASSNEQQATSFSYLETKPHTALNANMRLHSKLGFLQVINIPYHYLFLDQPVRRSRMFVSLRSHPDFIVGEDVDDDDHNTTKGSDNNNNNNSGSGGSISPYITCKGYRPIIHNFPLPNGDMVPIGEELLTVGLPQDILWEHSDLETAPALKNDEGERWWSKAITLEEGESVFQRYFDRPEIQGPVGSLSVVRAHSSFVGKASAISESFDPRHRQEMCFYDYIVKWREQKPFSGMQFMDWVDYGTDLNDDMVGQPDDDDDYYCVKKKFNARTVHFFNETERKEHEVYLSASEDGQEVIARYRSSGEVVGPSPEDYPHLYMFDMNKQMYVVDKNLWDKEKYGSIKHTAVLAGKPALSAGEAYFKEGGVITGINWDSGHYRPQIEALTMMFQWIKDQGLNTAGLNWMARKQWSTKDCHETDWDSFEIHAFDAKVLYQTCQEATKSPTWTYDESYSSSGYGEKVNQVVNSLPYKIVEILLVAAVIVSSVIYPWEW